MLACSSRLCVDGQALEMSVVMGSQKKAHLAMSLPYKRPDMGVLLIKYPVKLLFMVLQIDARPVAYKAESCIFNRVRPPPVAVCLSCLISTYRLQTLNLASFITARLAIHSFFPQSHVRLVQ
jgi:hypothetical protein